MFVVNLPYLSRQRRQLYELKCYEFLDGSNKKIKYSLLESDGDYIYAKFVNHKYPYIKRVKLTDGHIGFVSEPIDYMIKRTTGGFSLPNEIIPVTPVEETIENHDIDAALIYRLVTFPFLNLFGQHIINEDNVYIPSYLKLAHKFVKQQRSGTDLEKIFDAVIAFEEQRCAPDFTPIDLLTGIINSSINIKRSLLKHRVIYVSRIFDYFIETKHSDIRSLLTYYQKFMEQTYEKYLGRWWHGEEAFRFLLWSLFWNGLLQAFRDAIEQEGDKYKNFLEYLLSYEKNLAWLSDAAFKYKIEKLQIEGNVT